MSKPNVKLRALAKKHRETKCEILDRTKVLTQSFNLSPEEQSRVAFEMPGPIDRSLQKYHDIVDMDERYIQLNRRMRNLFLEGSVIILKMLKKHRIYIPRHKWKKNIQSPHDHFPEIEQFMESLNGYRHLIIHGTQVPRNINLSHYLVKHPKVRRTVNVWFSDLSTEAISTKNTA
ncbi:MAG: hypothetical protein HC905_07225 [Bacteroidales bacterium]|nr:hypothetical protein [Bacteroidales bacterium]